MSIELSPGGGQAPRVVAVSASPMSPVRGAGLSASVGVSANVRGKSNHQQSIEALKDELEREIQRNVQLRAKNGKLSRDLSSKELKISRLRNDLVAASAIIDATKLKLVQTEGKCKDVERELDTVQKEIIADHASLDLERKQMVGKLEESDKELEELRAELDARDRKLEVLKTEMEKLREGEEDKELKILSLEDLCGVKEREVARYSDMLQEMQKRLHADHTAVLNEKTSVAKDLAAVKLALQESQIKIEREVQERRSIEHDLKMTRERMDKQKETQANELQKADKELAALTSAKGQIEAQRIEVVAEMGQVREELRRAQDAARAHEIQAKALQAEVERFSALLQEETASKEEIGRRMDQLNEELRGKTKNIHDEATAASEARRECTLLKQREKALREEITRAIAAKDMIAEQLSEQHRAMGTRAKRYNDLESMARTFERERDNALDKLADLEATQGSSTQALSELEISAAERDIRVKELESANEIIARELEMLQADHRSLTQRHKDGETALKEARSTIQKLRAEAEETRSKYNNRTHELEQELSQLENEHHELKAELNSARRDLGAEQEKTEQAESRVRRAEERAGQLLSQLDQDREGYVDSQAHAVLKRQAKELEKRNDTLERENVRLGQALGDADQRVASLQRDLEDASLSHNRLMEKNVRLQDDARNANRETGESHERFEVLRAKCEGLEQELARAEGEKSKLATSLREAESEARQAREHMQSQTEAAMKQLRDGRFTFDLFKGKQRLNVEICSPHGTTNSIQIEFEKSTTECGTLRAQNRELQQKMKEQQSAALALRESIDEKFAVAQEAGDELKRLRAELEAEHKKGKDDKWKVEELTIKCESQRSRLQDANDIMQSLRQELEKRQQLVAHFQDEANTISVTADELMAELRHAKKLLVGERKRAKILSTTVEQQKTEIARHLVDVQRFQAESARLENSTAALEHRLERAEEKATLAEEDRERKVKEATRQLSEMQEAQKKLKSKMREADKDGRNNRRRYDREIDGIQRELAVVRAAKKELEETHRQKMQNMVEEQKSMRAEIARLQRERERPSQLLAELKALREQQASWTTSVEEAEDAKRLRTALERTEAELSRTAHSLSSTQTMLSEIEQMKATLEEQLRKARDLVAKSERKLKIQEEEYMAVAKQAKQMYELKVEECEQAKEENVVLQDELDRLSRGGTEVEMLVEQKRVAEDDAQRAREQLKGEQDRNKRMGNQLDMLYEQTKGILKRNESLAKEMGELREAAKRHGNEKKALMEKLESASALLNDARTKERLRERESLVLSAGVENLLEEVEADAGSQQRKDRLRGGSTFLSLEQEDVPTAAEVRELQETLAVQDEKISELDLQRDNYLREIERLRSLVASRQFDSGNEASIAAVFGKYASPATALRRARTDSESSIPGQTRSVLKSKLRSTQLALDETEMENERLRSAIDRKAGIGREPRDRLFSGEYADDERFEEDDDEVERGEQKEESEGDFEMGLSAAAASNASRKRY